MSKIIAVDFDGCLITNEFPAVGEPIPATIDALKLERENGAKVILWTCRVNEQLAAAVAWCAEQGIHLDAVNRNLPEIVESFGGDTVKVFANEYWDDRAVRMPPPSPPVKHGHWTKVGDDNDYSIVCADPFWLYRCSCCGYISEQRGNTCPCCAADMRTEGSQ